ncbi:MAG: hypothetical protein ACJ8FO_04350 [Sphingomicrobium sp.]
MQELDSGGPQLRFVVTFLGAKVNDSADCVPLRELGRALQWEAAADRELLGQPVEVQALLDAHNIFFFNHLIIIFFIFW